MEGPTTLRRFERQYALYGALFGLCFPAGATAFEAATRLGSLMPSGWLGVQRATPLLWIIDSAPLWLGLFASLAGRRQDALTGTLVEIRKMNLALQTTNTDLQRASAIKSQFLANMSHELRTPLNSIIGFTDLVLNRTGEALPERQRKNLEKVVSNAQHLLELINSVLDLSKIEAGKMELSPERFGTSTFLEATADTAEVLLKGKPVQLLREISGDLPALYADKTRLRQIVLNLLSNACKFTERGSVTLAASAVEGRRSGDAERLLKIEVRDTGIGMAEKDLPAIFEEFRQVDGSSARRFGGTGLGLTIARKMLQLMGGEITVHSKVGEGTTFTAVIPFGHEPFRGASAPAPVSHAYPSPALEAAAVDGVTGAKTILVVDDEPDSVMLVRETLDGENFRVVSAFSAQDGLRIAAQTQPFAILVDIMMPVRDGWDLLRDLKANPATAQIPVIVLSVVDNKPLGFALGATDYLTKPVEGRSLLAAFSRISRSAVKEVLVVDDDANMREIVGEILGKEGLAIATARDGAEAMASLEKKIPDLVILDLMMPVVDGFEVVRRMRADKRWSDVPVLVLTARDLDASERNSLASSGERIVQKRTESGTVLTHVREILDGLSGDGASRTRAARGGG